MPDTIEQPPVFPGISVQISNLPNGMIMMAVVLCGGQIQIPIIMGLEGAYDHMRNLQAAISQVEQLRKIAAEVASPNHRLHLE